MIDSLFVIFSTLLIITGLAHAQISAPSCSNSTYAWSFNSLSQSPCLVAAYLSGVCSNGSFVISALSPPWMYTNPGGPDTCTCNTVTYNLISACAACQSAPWMPYSLWSKDCTPVATAGTFPGPIPAETRVPRWAYLDPTTGDNWNSTAAALAGDSPEVTGRVSTVPPPTVTVPITVLTVQISVQSSPTLTSSTEASSAPHSSSSKTGRIAGVVGGVIGATLIAGLVTWCTVRRRRARSARSAIDVSDQHGVVAHRLPIIEAPRLYDPSDPSTYPRSTPFVHLYQTNQNNQNRGSVSDLQPPRQAFNGLPEI